MSKRFYYSRHWALLVAIRAVNDQIARDYDQGRRLTTPLDW